MIKGEGKDMDMQKWMERLIIEKIGVECKILYSRSGPVYIAKLGNMEKREVVKNKYKLKGNKIFIENDLS